MGKWLIMLICFAITFFSVLFVEMVKQIIKFIFKKKGKELNMKKSEYPLAFSTILICFASIFSFLYFGKFIEISIVDICKLSSIFACSSQAIYIFLIQAPRKGFNWTVSMVKRLIARLKKGEKVENIIEDIKDNNELDNSNENKDIDKEIEKFKNDLLKINYGK